MGYAAVAGPWSMCHDGGPEVLLPDNSTKLVSELKVGDAIATASLTEHATEPTTAWVTTNVQSEGEVDFVHFTTSHKAFNVTANHIMVIENAGELELKRASDVMV